MDALARALHKRCDFCRAGSNVRVAELITAVPGATIISGRPDTDVDSVEVDSRKVSGRSMFCCVVGSEDDGHRFAAAAARAGASSIAIEHDVELDEHRDDLTLVRIPEGSSRRSAAILSAAVVGNPARELTMVGVTGTNGKTTVTSLLGEILTASGLPSTVIGTLTGERTTPSSPELHRLLSEARSLAGRSGRRGAVAMEVSSHALDQERVAGIEFDVAVFTNLSHDHLDYHGTMDRYFEAKARLFETSSSKVAVIWEDSDEGRLLLDRRAHSAIGVGWSDAADIQGDALGTRFGWRNESVRSPLIGRFNVSNVLLAAEAAVAIGIAPAEVASAISSSAGVPGRMQVVAAPAASPIVLVDYAHTPVALAAALEDARRLAAPDGQVTVVFGCGGDRDQAKRPAMGAIASDLADMAIVTTDNPRSESPAAIAAAILGGATGGARIIDEPDRAAAIRTAIALAGEGDVVLVAGKGHETIQVIGERSGPFDDRMVAEAALVERGGSTSC